MTRILFLGALLSLGACQTASTPPEPVEISDAEIIPIDDDDLEVLDRLWG